MDRWPKEQERNPEEIYRELAELESRAPKATPEEAEAAGGSHYQFGNNFYLLFIALKDRAKRPHLTEIYLERAEGLGDNWKRFVQENQDLVGRINSALDETAVYDELMHRLRDLYMGGRGDLADKTEELKIEEVGIAAWNKLSPLLKEAAERMRACGIEPKQFFG
jgi:hypothetical protein